MIVLILFALLAGAGTALSPCVWPILPVVLAAGATGGRRRPLGIVVGLVVSFAFATAVLAWLIRALGLPDDLLRTLAIAVLALFGLSLVVPALRNRLEAAFGRLTRLGPNQTEGRDGFWGGVLVGGSLGFVWAPCAGPILAAVIGIAATRDVSAEVVVIALAYGAGAGAVLLAVMTGGRRLLDRSAWVSRHTGRLQQALGALMLVAAVLMFANLDTRFQTAIAQRLPDFVTNPTTGLERSHAVAGSLQDLRGRGPHINGRTQAVSRSADEAGVGRSLPRLGAAPPFTGTQRWFNTSGGRSLSLRGLRGHVVLIDFWTYTCINCIRTFPHLKALDRKYGRDGLTIVGVHSPEFPFEKKASNVAAAIHQNGLRYPVVQDNDLATWSAYGNQYWPAEYLIDQQGQVRYTHFGEGDDAVTERAIRGLLAAGGRRRLGSTVRVGDTTPQGRVTPETYLGTARAEGFVNPGGVRPGRHRYRVPSELPLNAFALGGGWLASPESATAGAGATVGLHFQARHVYLVLSSPGRPRALRVLLDGRPVSARAAGRDVKGATVSVRRQRLYELVSLPRAGEHLLSLRFQPGLAAFAFTFG